MPVHCLDSLLRSVVSGLAEDLADEPWTINPALLYTYIIEPLRDPNVKPHGSF